MTVSVIIPTYNSAAFVGRAIESVLAQTLLPAEIILVDNNSTDHTLEVLRAYASNYPKLIQVITATVQGPSAARNAGLRLATTEWIQFLDSDDTLPPDKLSVQLSWCPLDAAWIVGGYQELDLAGNRVDFLPDNDLWLGLATGRGIGCTCSNLFRRTLLLKHHGYREDWPDAEDHELYFRLLTSTTTDEPTGAMPWIDQAIRCIVYERSENKQSRNDLANHLARRIELHQQLHAFLKTKAPAYYQQRGDLLKAHLLNNYRYWAAFDRVSAVTGAEAFFRSPAAWPAHQPDIMPYWVFLAYRWLGFRRAEWLREFFR